MEGKIFQWSSLNLKKSLSLSFIAAFAVSLFAVAPLSLAAANDYTVTGGNPLSLPSPGATSATLPTVTLTDAGGDDFTNDPETLQVNLNTVSYPGVVFDTTVTTATIAGTCGYTTGGTVNYTNSDQRATFTISGGTNCANTETITIAGLKVKTLYASAAPGAAPLVNVDNVTTAAGTPVATSNNVNIIVSANTLASTNVQPNSLNRGSNVNITATFTTTNYIPTNGMILIGFGPGFDVTNVSNATCPLMDGTFDVTQSSQVVTIARNGDIPAPPGAYTCTFTGITNPVVNGTTGLYSIKTTYDTTPTHIMDSDPAVTADMIVSPSGGTSGVNGGGSYVWTPDGVSTGNAVVTSSSTSDTSTTNLATPPAVEPTPPTAEVTVDETPVVVEAPEEVIPASPFIDIKGHFSESFVNKLYFWKVVQGRTATMYEPDAKLTRAEMLKIALLLFKYQDVLDEKAVNPFTDEKGWWDMYAAAGKEAGIISGYSDGSFRPNSFVTRAEAAKILTVASKKMKNKDAKAAPFTDVMQDAWYAPYVNFLYENGVVSGKTKEMFAPNDSITRGEMAKMGVNLYELKI